MISEGSQQIDTQEERAAHRLEAFPAENFLIDSRAPQTLPYQILPDGGLDR